MHKRIRACCLALPALFALFAASRVAAQTPGIQTPRTFTVQGSLSRPDGTPVPDGTQSIRFSLWDAPSGGNLLWTSQLDLPAAHGVFNATLGEKDPFPDLSPDDGRLYNASWLEIQVGDDIPMTPRLRVGPVPSAVRAATVDDGAINSASKLANGVVGTDQIADRSVVALNIRPGAISADKLSPSIHPDDPAGGDLSARYPNPQLRLTPSSLVKVSDGAMVMGATLPALDQSQELHNGEIFSGHWQSFTTGKAGYLAGLDIYCALPGSATGDATLNIYMGEGPTQFPTSSQPITIGKTLAWRHFDLAKPLLVPGAGAKITWLVSAGAGINIGYAGDSAHDVYPGGRNDLTADYMFRTYMAGLSAGIGTAETSTARIAVTDPGAGRTGILTGNPGYVAPESNAKLLITEDGSTTQWPFEIDRAGAILYAVRQDGSIFSASSRRLKTNVTPLKNPLQTAMKLRPVSFDWKQELGGGQDFGLVAEEAAGAMPELVAAGPGGSGTAGVRYDRVGVIAIGAIQQQQAALDNDADRIQSIEARLSALEQSRTRARARRGKEDRP